MAKQVTRFLDYAALWNRGIRYSKVQLWRKVKAGTFPKPVRMGNRNFWLETDIETWSEGLIAARDAGVAA